MSIDTAKARAIFTSAVEKCPPEAWPEFLDKACGEDTALRRRVEALLKAHQGDDSLLDRGESEGSAQRAIQSPIAEPPGTVIGPYKLLQKIGDGGMGVVYMAEQTEPVQRRVALKIIAPGMDSRQVIARFEAERHALSMMDHPNIARVLDAGTTASGRPYFVMELVKGVPITQYCDQHKLTPRQRLELFVPVCHAVQHAHQKGIIHRDIKPTNVLVAEYDDKPVPKIIDFGVAKAIDQRLTQRTMFTQLGQVVGTIDYMSPEQAKLNQLDVDTRSDIYSLGVLLYELLTGQTPFDRQRLRTAAFDEMLRIIREEEPPRASVRLSGSQALPAIAASRQVEATKLSTLLRGELDWILMKAMEKERSRRYETANAMAGDLEHYLKDEPVAACPPSAGYRFRKFARRNRPALMAGAAIGLSLLLASIVSTWQAVRAREALRSEAAAKVQAEEAQQMALRRADEATAAKAEAERASVDAQAVSVFLVNGLLSSAAPYRAMGREVTVREALGNAEKSIDTAFKDHPLREAAVRYSMTLVYSHLGDFITAERHARRSLELRTTHLGREHRDTLTSASGLGTVLLGQSRFDEARGQHEWVLACRRRSLGLEHPETLQSMVNLAETLEGLGRLNEAQRLLEEALAIRKRLLPPEDPAVLITMGRLSDILLRRGKWEQGRAAHEKVLAVGKRVLGPEHPETIRSMAAVGEALMQERKLDEARKLLEETHALASRICGPDHPITLNAYTDLARALWMSGRTDEVRKLYEPLLTGNKRADGSAHPLTPEAMYRLGTALRNLGELDGAHLLLREALAHRQQTLGPEHPQTLWCKHNLATVLYDLGKVNDARRLFEEVLAVQQRTCSPGHPDTVRTMGNLAELLWYHDGKEEARKLCEQIRSIAPEDPHLLQLLVNVADDLRVRGEPAEARKLQEETLAIQKRVLGPEHQHTLLSMHNLALTLWKLGKLSDARTLLEQALSAQQRVLGPEHVDTLLSMNNLGLLLAKLGQPDEARKLLEQALAGRERALGQDHPATLGTRHQLDRMLKARPATQATATTQDTARQRP